MFAERDRVDDDHAYRACQSHEERGPQQSLGAAPRILSHLPRCTVTISGKSFSPVWMYSHNLG